MIANIENLNEGLRELNEIVDCVRVKDIEDKKLILFLKKKIHEVQEVALEIEDEAVGKKPIPEDDNPFLNRSVKPLTVIEVDL